MGPGFLVSFAGAGISLAFFQLDGLPTLPEPNGVGRVVIFLLLCVPLCWLIDRYRSARALAAETGKELRTNEARYRKIVDTAEEGILTLDTLGHIDYVNPRLCRMLGWTAEELCGCSLHACLFGEDYSRADWDFEQLLKGETRKFEIRLRRKTGEPVWVRISASPLPGEAAIPAGILWMVTDLTEQKRQEAELAELLAREQSVRSQAEAAQRRLAFLAEATALLSASLDYSFTLQQIANLVVPELADWCVVDVIDEEGEIQRLGLAHADASVLTELNLLKAYVPRWERQEGVARVLREGLPELYSRIPGSVLDGIAQDERHRALLETLGFQSMISVPLRARARIVGALSLVFGHSGRSYDAGDLAFAEELAGRAALALDNARNYRDAHESSLRKDEFLAVLAHELRSPLAAIANAAYLLQRRDGAQLSRLQEIIERQAQHLARLVEDLLDVSRIAQGKVQLRKQRVDLAQVVQRAVETVRPLIETRAHTLELKLPEGEVWVHGDPIRLTQIFSNMLTNAAKYTERGGKIWVAMEVAGWPEMDASPAAEAVVRVRDNGVGLPPEWQSQVFEPFTQAERSPGRELGGLGIGLALVKHLVDLHGGVVAVNSEGEGKGCEFSVHLPLLVEAPACQTGGDPQVAATATGDAGSQLAGRVLVVEDNVDAAETLVEVLVHWGFDARRASTGQAALELAVEWRPNIVILDLGLPDMSGYEVARRLRSRPTGDTGGRGGAEDAAGKRTSVRVPEPVLIALTGQGAEEERRRAAASGFDAFLLKPAAPDELMEALISDGRRSAA